MASSWHDLTFYLLSIVLALAGGWVQIAVHDLLFTALWALAATLLLGALRPQKPWRWALIFVVGIPVLQALARLTLIEKPTRAEVYESVLVLLPAIVGAYGGSVLRRALATVWSKQ